MRSQLFHHHELWEDWHAGFYALRYDNESAGVTLAATLLSDSGERWPVNGFTPPR
jgi:hypothetical protein